MNRRGAIRNAASSLLAIAAVYALTMVLGPTPWLAFWVLVIAAAHLFVISFNYQDEVPL